MVLRRVFHSLLTMSLALVYIAGPVVAVEVEHAHEKGHDAHSHFHAGTETGAAHHHGRDHHHHHSEAPCEDSEDGEESPDPLSHSHVVSLGVDIPLSAPGLPGTRVAPWSGFERRIPEAEPCPDGPFYKLSKPPQLV